MEKSLKSSNHKVSIWFQAPVPQDMAKIFNAENSPIPEDVLIKAGKERNQPQIRIQTASTGEPA